MNTSLMKKRVIEWLKSPFLFVIINLFALVLSAIAGSSGNTTLFKSIWLTACLLNAVGLFSQLAYDRNSDKNK